MSAYATSPALIHPVPSRNDGATSADGPFETLVMESLLAQLADRLATAVVEQIRGASEVGDEWFDSPRRRISRVAPGYPPEARR
jgi:hypothetical protein